jgi:hypothetical protein
MAPRGARWLFEKGEGKPITIEVKSSRGARTTVLDFAAGDVDDDSIRWRAQGPLIAEGGVSGEVSFTSRNQYKPVTTSRPPSLGQVRWLAPYSPIQAQLHEVYSEVVTQGRRTIAKGIIRAVIPGFEDVEILVEGEQPVVHVVFENHSVPVSLMGSGVMALVQLALELAARPQGTVLLEEPEVHEHPAAMRQSARAILEATRRQIQVLFSTHSLDFIDSLLAEATPEDRQGLAVFRFARTADGVLRSTRISGDEVLQARGTIGDDLR